MVESRANRADGDTERLSDLGVGKLMGEAQVQHLAMVHRERPDHFAGQIEPRIFGGRALRRRLRLQSGDEDFPLPVSALPRSATQMPGDAEEVGAGRFGAGTFFEPLRHLHKGILHEIPRHFSIPVATGKIPRQVIGRVSEELLEVWSLLYGVQGGQWSEVFSSST